MATRFLLALTWSAQEGCHVPPWNDHIGAEIHFWPCVNEILTLWLPDCEAMSDPPQDVVTDIAHGFEDGVYDEPAIWR